MYFLLGYTCFMNFPIHMQSWEIAPLVSKNDTSFKKMMIAS